MKKANQQQSRQWQLGVIWSILETGEVQRNSWKTQQLIPSAFQSFHNLYLCNQPGPRTVISQTDDRDFGWYFLFIYLGLTSLSTHFIGHITPGGLLVEETSAEVVGQDFCTVNYRPSVSLPPTFPHTGQVRESNPRLQRWEASVLPLRHWGPWDDSLSMFLRIFSLLLVMKLKLSVMYHNLKWPSKPLHICMGSLLQSECAIPKTIAADRPTKTLYIIFLLLLIRK